MRRIAVPLTALVLIGCAAARRAEMERLGQAVQRDVRSTEGLAGLLKDMDRLAERIETPEERIEMGWLFLRLGRVLREGRQFEAALKVQRRVGQEFGEGCWWQAHLEMAETCQWAGDYGGAMEILRRLESSWDGRFSTSARVRMAQVELQRNRPDEALRFMEQAASGVPGALGPLERQARGSAVVYLANHHENAGDLRAALRWWKDRDSCASTCGTCSASMYQSRVIKIAEIHVRLGEVDEAVAELRAGVSAGWFFHKSILSYIEAVGLVEDPRKEFEAVDRLPDPGRRRCRAALKIREGFLAGDPRTISAVPVENEEYQVAGIFLGRLGDRAAEYLCLRIILGDPQAIRLAGWTGLPSLIPALEARLDREDSAPVRSLVDGAIHLLRSAAGPKR